MATCTQHICPLPCISNDSSFPAFTLLPTAYLSASEQVICSLGQAFKRHSRVCPQMPSPLLEGDLCP